MPAMTERLYRSLVATIERYAFWIKVRDADGFQEGAGISGTGRETTPVRCLTLYASYQYGRFPSGYEWRIPLADIHKAVRRIGTADQRYDAERIICEASYGIIHLHLV